jgi:hypothetical protein
MDVDSVPPVPLNRPTELDDAGKEEQDPDAAQQHTGPLSAERRTTEGSFHSAREDQTAKVSFKVPETKNGELDVASGQELPTGRTVQQEQTEDLPQSADPNPLEIHERSDLGQELDEIGSPSDGSTPDRPLVRKSSLTFASLPAREPLTTKRSIGARDSRTSHLDQLKNGRGSYYGRQTGLSHPPQADQQQDNSVDDEVNEVDENKDAQTGDADFEAVQAHNKSSTQRLHEKIEMLGKSQPTRLSKSIPSAAALAASNLRKSEAISKVEKGASKAQPAAESGVDEDDDWIKPLEQSSEDFPPALTKSHNTDMMEVIVANGDDNSGDEDDYDMRAPELIAHEERMRTPIRKSPSPMKTFPGFGHAKSASTVTLASPGKAEFAPGPAHTKTISVSNPPYPSTTPKGSPRRIFDAPLSVSKSKLQSIMKTAKGLFTSSAGVSAAAKMETLSPNALRIAANNMPGLYPNIQGMLEDKPLPPSPPKEGRRTRSSTEREKEEKKKERDLKDRQKAEDQLEKARQKEKQNAAQFKDDERNAQTQASRLAPPVRKSPRRLGEKQREPERPNDSHDMPPPALPSLQGKPQRPAKPTRELLRKNQPQPVAVRVGSTQRMPISTSSLASNLQETLPPTNSKQNLVTKKASNASLTSAASNQAFKTSVTSQAGKPKALLAAERKKEADEREAQRKLGQKREMERKRAAQQDEARRQEQRQRAEAERKERERFAAEQAKKAAQQQAIEKRRQEQARKMEQQRNANAADDLVSLPSMDCGNDAYQRSLRCLKLGLLHHKGTKWEPRGHHPDLVQLQH